MSKSSLEGLLEKLKERTEESVSNVRQMEAVNGSGKLARHYYYCPQCLTVEVFFRSYLYRMKRKGKKPECFRCKVEMKPIDEHFKAEYEKTAWAFYEKAKSVLERAWPIMDSWWRGVKGYMADTGLVEVYFDAYSYLSLRREGRGVKARLYLHYLENEKLEDLLKLISILREEGQVKGEVQVDGRQDHCEVPEEKMRSHGFIRTGELGKIPHDDFYLEL